METIDTNRVYEIPMSDIFADEEFNCRGKIAPIDVVDLASDIEKDGLIQPVVVTPREGEPKYLLIAGYRRYSAHRVLQWETIRAVIREGVNEKDARLLNLKENLLRKNLNILEEANAIKKLFELGVTEHDAAKELQASRGWVQVRYMLLQLPDDAQKECAAGILTQEDIRQLYSLRNDPDAQVNYVKAVKDAKLKGGKVMKVRAKQNRKPSDKRIRKRPEIFDMMEHIQKNIGNGLHTRTLAWCAGEISDYELFQSLLDFANDKGIDYVAPQKGEDY